MKEHYLKVRKIYKIARAIFGDVVISAYIECCDEKDLQRTANKYKHLKDEDISLSYDGDTIILEFKNGNKVRFTNSEWASMSKCDDFNCE